MLKGNYKAWIISITLHAMLLLLFVRYGKSVKLPAVAEPPKVINAYVSVDLTSLPSLQKTQDKPLLEQPQEIVDEAKKDYQQAQDRKIYQPAIGKLTVTLE